MRQGSRGSAVIRTVSVVDIGRALVGETPDFGVRIYAEFEVFAATHPVDLTRLDSLARLHYE